MPVSIRDDYPMHAASSGQCYICGAGRRDVRDSDGTLRKERVVDLGVSIDFEGYLCVCETCALEAGRLLGLVAPTERDAAARFAADLEADNLELRAQLAESRQLVRLLREYDERPDVAVSEPEPVPVAVSALGAEAREIEFSGLSPTVTVDPARKTKARPGHTKGR